MVDFGVLYVRVIEAQCRANDAVFRDLMVVGCCWFLLLDFCCCLDFVELACSFVCLFVVQVFLKASHRSRFSCSEALEQWISLWFPLHLRHSIFRWYFVVALALYCDDFDDLYLLYCVFLLRWVSC